MKLLLQDGILYRDNLFFCYADGDDLPAGRFPVEVRYSHAHGEDLIHADGLGWVGATRGSRVVLGRIRRNPGVDPCGLTAGRLASSVESEMERGATVTLEVRRG